jgi:Protein of unknown function (DUF2934)
MPKQLQRRNSAMKTSRTPKDMPEPDLEQQKQAIAYQLWEDEGRPDGKAEEHWAQACLVVMSLAEGEALPSPIWLQRQDNAPTVGDVPTLPGAVENISKRAATRHAA